MLLRSLHLAAFCIHLANTVATFFFHIDKAETPVLRPLHKFTANAYTSTGQETLFWLQPLWLVTINELFTCLSHGVALWLLSSAKDEQQINAREYTRRAYEYMITAGILQCALVLGVGATYLSDLIFLLVVNVVIQLLGVSIDMAIEFRDRYNSIAIFWYYVMAFLLLFSEIVFVLLHCLSLDSPPSMETTFFFIMGAVYGIYYVCFGLVKLFVMDSMKANEIYCALSVTTKVILSWVLIGNTHYGFLQLFDRPPADVVDLDWPAFIYSLTISLTLILVALVYWILSRRYSELPVDDRLDL